jgi:hypothetical protein
MDNLGRYYDLALWQEYLQVKARWEFAHQEYVSCPLENRDRTRTVLMAERATMDILLAKLRATPEHLEAFGW